MGRDALALILPPKETHFFGLYFNDLTIYTLIPEYSLFNTYLSASLESHTLLSEQYPDFFLPALFIIYILNYNYLKTILIT